MSGFSVGLVYICLERAHNYCQCHRIMNSFCLAFYLFSHVPPPDFLHFTFRLHVVLTPPRLISQPFLPFSSQPSSSSFLQPFLILLLAFPNTTVSLSSHTTQTKHSNIKNFYRKIHFQLTHIHSEVLQNYILPQSELKHSQ